MSTVKCLCCGCCPFAPQIHFPCFSTLTLGGQPSENVPACWLLGFSQWKSQQETTVGAERQDRKVITPSIGLQFASGSIYGHSFSLEVRTVTAHSGFQSYSSLLPLTHSFKPSSGNDFLLLLVSGRSLLSLLIPGACSYLHKLSFPLRISRYTTLECDCIVSC